MSPNSDDEFPDKVSFCLDRPLYTKINFQTHAEPDRYLYSLIEGEQERPYRYCPHCQKQCPLYSSPFYDGPIHQDFVDNQISEVRNQFTVRFKCSNCHNDTISWFVFDEYEIEKVGQYPSLANLHSAEIEHLGSVLKSNERSELVKASGLASHGVGVAAFIYLRRVYEKVIFRIHEENEGVIEKSNYSAMPMKQRIEALSEHLPKLMVSTVAAYDLLNKGLHELSEDECLDMFPTLHRGLVMILEDMAYIKQQTKAREEYMQEVARAKTAIGQKDD